MLLRGRLLVWWVGVLSLNPVLLLAPLIIVALGDKSLLQMMDSTPKHAACAPPTRGGLLLSISAHNTVAANEPNSYISEQTNG